MKHIALALLLTITAAPVVRGQSKTVAVRSGPADPPAIEARDSGGRLVVRATRIDAPLRIDGQLDERAYETIPSVSGFVQQEPHEGAPATERTEVWIFYDNSNVYVSFRCWETQPNRVIAQEMRRDNSNIFNGDDSVSILFDTFHDQQNADVFTINPIGGRQDGQVSNERQYSGDWNPVWSFHTGRFPGGWTVETAFPFKSLRYGPGRQQVWGFNARRVNRWKNEISYLSQVPAARGNQGIQQVSAAATLIGLEAPASGRTLELKPFVTSSVTTDTTATPQLLNHVGGDIGLDDAKFGLTQSVTADITYNTDFAQVEADEQQINLTRFSLFFPEKRDFFLESAGTFSFGGVPLNGRSDAPILFYSRRIGLTDEGSVPIVAGGRVTGQVGRIGIGLVGVRTGADSAIGVPATTFSAIRVDRNILRKSTIGAMYTGRSIGLSGSGTNQAYGLDTGLAFFDNLTINAYWARTATTGLSGNDTSYRGRPNYDGDRYGVQLVRTVVGQNFNPELGFVKRPDMHRSFAQFRFSPRPLSIPSVRKFSWTGKIDYISDGEGRLETRQRDGEFQIQFQSGDQFLAGYTDDFEFLPEPFEIATGVILPVANYHFGTARVGFNISQRRRVTANIEAQYGTFYDGHQTALTFKQGRLGITPHLSIEPSYSINRITLVEGSFTTHLISSRATYTMTPQMFVSALVQYNSKSASVGSNIRFRWEYRPGSELFIVYNEARDTLQPGFPQLSSRSLIFKINNLVRF